MSRLVACTAWASDETTRSYRTTGTRRRKTRQRPFIIPPEGAQALALLQIPGPDPETVPHKEIRGHTANPSP